MLPSGRSFDARIDLPKEFVRRAQLAVGPITLQDAEGGTWDTNLTQYARIRVNWGRMADSLGLQEDQILGLTALSTSRLLVAPLAHDDAPATAEAVRQVGRGGRLVAAAAQRGAKRLEQAQHSGEAQGDPDGGMEVPVVEGDARLMAAQGVHTDFQEDSEAARSAKRQRKQPLTEPEVRFFFLHTQKIMHVFHGSMCSVDCLSGCIALL